MASENGTVVARAKPVAGELVGGGAKTPMASLWHRAIRETLDSDEAIEKIKKGIQAQLDKVASGDAKALEYVMGLAGKVEPSAAQPPAAPAVSFIVNLPANAAPEDVADPLRTRVYAVLEALGDMPIGELERNLSVPAAKIRAAMDHPWFEERRGAGGERVWGLRRDEASPLRRIG